MDCFLWEIEGKQKFPFPSEETVRNVSVSPRFPTKGTWGNFATFCSDVKVTFGESEKVLTIHVLLKYNSYRVSQVLYEPIL